MSAPLVPRQQANNPPASSSSSASASANSSSTSSIPQTVPAGSITITNPPQTATSFYKIAPSQPITFAWNFTDLLVTQTHLTVSAVGANGNTYPVGPTNGIIPGTATSVVWDPYSYNQNSGSQVSYPSFPVFPSLIRNPQPTLAMGTYTLKIWGDLGPDSVRSPGQLQPNTALQFALYTPQAYTPISSGELLASPPSPYASHDATTNLPPRLVMHNLQWRPRRPLLPPRLPGRDGHLRRHAPQRMGRAQTVRRMASFLSHFFCFLVVGRGGAIRTHYILAVFT